MVKAGSCKRKDKCRFSHNNEAVAPDQKDPKLQAEHADCVKAISPRAAKVAQPETEQGEKDQSRAICSASWESSLQPSTLGHRFSLSLSDSDSKSDDFRAALTCCPVLRVKRTKHTETRKGGDPSKVDKDGADHDTEPLAWYGTIVNAVPISNA